LFILADANEREIVTASGRPSGIATTITVIAIMIVSNIWFQNGLVVKLRSKFGVTHLSDIGGVTQAVRFPHPHGIQSIASNKVLISIARNVRTAHPIPTLPILLAIVSSFSYKSVGDDPA